MSLIRQKIKTHDYIFFFHNPFYFFYFFIFIIRAILLRIKLQETKYLFINLRINQVKTPLYVNDKKYSYFVFDTLTKEIKEFTNTRSKEGKNIFSVQYLSDISKRFSNGNKACCIIEDGKIISILFLAFNQDLIKEINFSYNAQNKEAIIKDIYTIKNRRKMGLYYLLLKKTVVYLKNMGIDNITMWIMPHNKATIHAQLKVGFQQTFQSVTYFTWFGLKYSSLKFEHIPLEQL